jgi:hypothetical protein
MRGDAKVTLPKAYFIFCYVTPLCEEALVLHERFFKFVFDFVCDRWQNRETCLRLFVREAR